MTPAKERAISALLTSTTKKEAAEKAKIGERTLRDYFTDEEFVERYRQACAGVIEDASRQGQQLLSPALLTLKDVMEDTETPPAARISAARAALEFGLRLTEINDILKELGDDVL